MILLLPDDIINILNNLSTIRVNKNIPYKYYFVKSLEINMLGHTCKSLYNRFKPKIVRKIYIENSHSQTLCIIS